MLVATGFVLMNRDMFAGGLQSLTEHRTEAMLPSSVGVLPLSKGPLGFTG